MRFGDGQISLTRYKTELPNSLILSFEWQHPMDARKKIKERLCLQKERGDKDKFDLGEIVLVQNVKSGGWNTKGRILDVRTALDGTVQSYILDINGLTTTRHRKYLRKIPQKLLNNEESMNTTESGNAKCKPSCAC